MSEHVRVELVTRDGQMVALELDAGTAIRWHQAFERALTAYAIANRDAISAELAERTSS